MIDVTDVLLPIFAVAIIAGALTLVALAVDRLRNHDYRHFRLRNRSVVRAVFPAPPIVAGSLAEQRYASLDHALRTVHDEAKDAQTWYHRIVLGSATCLAIGFVVLAIEQIGPAHWPEWAQTRREIVEVLLGWVDLFALIAVLALYLAGRSRSRRWITRRAISEFIRQYQFLFPLFPQIAPADAADLEVAADAEIARVRAALVQGKFEDLPSRIEQLWRARARQLLAIPLGEDVVAPEGWATYLNRRVLRQIIWFRDSHDRLQAIAERRAIVLTGCYILAVVLAVAKQLLLTVAHTQWPALAFGLLLITGASAAMTAYYMNQNSRSLIHRYKSQVREIEGWIDGLYGVENAADRDATALLIQAADTAEVRRKILEFERWMVDELVDWIHISSHDSLELG